MANTFFEREGESFVATELCRGPWSAALAHGGPPAALLGRAIEALDPAMRVARVTIDLVRPVPLGRVSVKAELTRSGKSVKLAVATLSANEKELCRASALLVRRAAVSLPPLPEPARVPPPETGSPVTFPFFLSEVGYHTALDSRCVRGGFGRGAMALWMRMLHPLVAGEAPSPLQRVLIAADSGNGVSFSVDPKSYTFINPDLTVHLHRDPVGEWVCLDAVTTLSDEGAGLAHSTLHDERGPIGRGLQSLLVEKR